MASSERSQTATLTGIVSSTERAPIGGLSVTAVDAQEMLRQRSVMTDDAGRFAIDLPHGRYDLLFCDREHEPLILAGVVVEGDLAKEIVRPLADSRTPAVHGTVALAGGAPASGQVLELHDGTASNELASVTVGGDGHFEIEACEYGYHLLCIRGETGEEDWVPAPKPASAIEIDITLTGARPAGSFAVVPPTASSPAAAELGTTFNVCQEPDATWHLSGGLLAPDSGTLGTNVLPLKVNVYAEHWGPGTMFVVDRSTPESPFAPARPPAGYYHFTDETGETYLLTAILPYVHTTFYKSEKPNIVGIVFTQGIPYSGAWPTAPMCQ